MVRLTLSIRSPIRRAKTFVSKLNVALGRGDGTFGTPKLTAIPFGVQRLAVADVNGDAAPDLVLATSDFSGTTTLSLYRGIGDGSFTSPITIASGLAFTTSLVISELDGDSHLDIVASAGPNLQVYSGNGDGTFDTALHIPAASGMLRSVISTEMVALI